MRLSLPVLSILLLHTFFTGAQTLPCGGGRFSKRVFPASTATKGILFGHNTTYAGLAQDLYMDVFEPTGDVAAIRPLFIFAFGGSFLSGDRAQLADLCDSLAGKGYVTVAIDYRLYDNPAGGFGFLLHPNDAVDAVVKAMSDIKAAIRYFKRDAATTKAFRIDTASIFVGGISAGSIAALHAAYINNIGETTSPMSDIIAANGGMEGNTDLPGSPLIGTYSFQGIRGVWNMSGALLDSAYIKAGDPALFSIHGTADAVVPFGYGKLAGVAFVCGSSSLNNQAIKVGVPTKFIPVIGGDHEDMYKDPATAYKIDTTAPKFFANIICPEVLAVSGIALNGNSFGNRVELSWQTITESMNKGFEVERQMPSGWIGIGSINSKSVNGNSETPLKYTFIDLQPQTGSNVYRIKAISLSGAASYSNIMRVLWNPKSSDLFVIYPNPAKSTLKYKTTLTGARNILKIYSTDMRLVQTSTLNTLQAETVQISGLVNGLYLAVVFDSQNKRVASSWFLKK